MTSAPALAAPAFGGGRPRKGSFNYSEISAHPGISLSPLGDLSLHPGISLSFHPGMARSFFANSSSSASFGTPPPQRATNTNPRGHRSASQLPNSSGVSGSPTSGKAKRNDVGFLNLEICTSVFFASAYPRPHPSLTDTHKRARANTHAGTHTHIRAHIR